MKREAVRLYIQGLTSYRVLAVLLEQRIGRPVSRKTLNAWVLELGEQAATPLEISTRLRPSWGGYLGVDGKRIRIRGEEHVVLVGVDHPTQDLVHTLLLRAESGRAMAQLVEEARREAGYPLRGIVADLGIHFKDAHALNFPGIPYQACRAHFDRRLDVDIPKKGGERAGLHAELKRRIREVLYAASEAEALERYYALTADWGRYRGIGRYDPVLSLQRNFSLYTAHLRAEGLPPDNNVTENVIKQLNKKLRLMEGFASLENADRYVRLLAGCYRFKRFTDSCRGNGKAPLELAGVDLSGRDWLTHLLGSRP